MGLFSRNKPKIKIAATKKDGYSGWVKCAQCHELVHASELEKNCHCCPKCDHHYRLTGEQRIALLADNGSFEELFSHLRTSDPLSFVDTEPYTDRMKSAQHKSGRNEAVMCGTATLHEVKIALGVLDFSFMGGSMGSVVGERLTRLIEHALDKRLPLIIVSASGGARMQESIFSLMQMAKTSAALARLHEARIPYISVLTNPTTGGVTASFASLGDVIVAEPDALIGFAGPRVVEQTMRQKLPPKAQRAEFLLEKGMIDCIVNRHDLKDRLYTLIQFFTDNARTYCDDDLLSSQKRGELPQKLKELMALSTDEK